MKRRHEVLVGLLVLIAAVVGVVGTIWVARGGLATGYSLYARFPWGAGLKKGQPVFLAGVQIGYVKDATLDPNGTVVAEFGLLLALRAVPFVPPAVLEDGDARCGRD